MKSKFTSYLQTVDWMNWRVSSAYVFVIGSSSSFIIKYMFNSMEKESNKGKKKAYILCLEFAIHFCMNIVEQFSLLTQKNSTYMWTMWPS